MSQLTVEGATERVVQGMPELEKDFVQLQRASVHRNASLMEWVRAAHPECALCTSYQVAVCTAKLQPEDNWIQQLLKQRIKQQGTQFVRVLGRCGAGSAPKHIEAIHGGLSTLAQTWAWTFVIVTNACGEIHSRVR